MNVLRLSKVLNLKPSNLECLGLSVPGMPNGPSGMELHQHDSNSHDNYKSYEVFFWDDIKEEIFDKVKY